MLLASLRRSGSFLRQPSPLSLSLSLKTMRPLTLDSLNQQLQTVQYAVRGELAIKAETYRDQLKSGGHNLPFDKVISSNIGNPQQKGLDQPPITFTRQVAALTEWPALAELAPGVFPADVIARAKELQEEIGSIGAREGKTAGELRERPGRRRTGRGTGPNPYAKAATGPEERDPEQPKRKRKEEMGGWAHENASMCAKGSRTREATSRAEPTD
ncbi:hypothetical protein B0H14DRAFT_3863326 [Mycena olivaceomarginata]|nr:hypothetical protein B0H14DRAFT_3863326 [Mycena olivaceomarginata]